ncbi:stage II sporulation protein M [Candidatus Woesearchaeota archaeon]|nr:MAG: hypothetical protein QS99_C0002G0088 [archaeon GW2011_AR4]MBS3129130.1 stage II sporulation protein M [Candidatus Woesearchaeota archaeon]HIH37862.1 stage II sporulation protein M [Candidatus Woesearchaeota archaeon]HIH49241.1 stage II sporulation protein M [Candidatus Woesearchaeota archaeon]HIJ03990.1 stage II sporulation protein M [Candidatus Woesearchaeota archaeon]
MVVEMLINPLKAERHPFEMFFVGLFYASLACIISLWVFRENASLLMVFFTVFASAPFMYYTIKLEEKKDMLPENSETTLLKEHSKALRAFMALFLGITVAFALWYIFLPADLSRLLFEVQSATISEINNAVTGQASGFDIFLRILFNNIKVLAFCVLFAFVFGLGAIFILTWNASVIGAAMGNFIRGKLSDLAAVVGSSNTAHYFHAFSLSILRYAIHGIPEILAYFTGGLAGGIISIAVIRHDFQSEKFEKIILDSSDLLLISLGILCIAAFLEVFITPLFY